jgi:hypothetical protein
MEINSSHIFILAEAYKYETRKRQKMNVIAQNSEKFLTFGFNRYAFLDSIGFMNNPRLQEKAFVALLSKNKYNLKDYINYSKS